MTVKLGLNLSSLLAQRQLSQNNAELGQSFERLSSGQRINRASDDAAGLALSESLKASNRVHAQGLRNISDGVSILTLAESALSELTTIVTRQKELAQQASNGLYSNTQRAVFNTESDALTAEFNRIVETTIFNGQRLLNGSTGKVNIQLGFGIDESLSFSASELFGQAIANGTFTASAVPGHISQARGIKLVDLNRDGILDVFEAPLGTNGVTMLGNGDGTFKAAQTFVTGTPQAGERSVVLEDFNNDGYVDAVIGDGMDATLSVFFGNGDGSFKARVTFLMTGSSSNIAAAGDVNGDGRIDIIADRGVLLNNGNGTFSVHLNGGAATASHAVGDVNGDGLTDIIEGNAINYRIALSNGDGTFSIGSLYAHGFSTHGAFRSADFNRDGLADIAISEYGDQVRVFLSNGDGTFKLSSDLSVELNTYNVEAVDFNSDGILDLVGQTFLNPGNGGTTTIWYGNGDGTFKNKVTTGGTGYETYSAAFADLNGDDVLDIYHGGSGNNLLLSNSTKTYTAPYLNLKTTAQAQESLSITQKVLGRIGLEMGAIGAAQSRLQSAYSLNARKIENQTIAESRIRDVDVAEETAKLVQKQVVNQAAIAVLAQANQQPQIVLKLLGGYSTA